MHITACFTSNVELNIHCTRVNSVTIQRIWLQEQAKWGHWSQTVVTYSFWKLFCCEMRRVFSFHALQTSINSLASATVQGNIFMGQMSMCCLKLHIFTGQKVCCWLGRGGNQKRCSHWKTSHLSFFYFQGEKISGWQNWFCTFCSNFPPLTISLYTVFNNSHHVSQATQAHAKREVHPFQHHSAHFQSYANCSKSRDCIPVRAFQQMTGGRELDFFLSVAYKVISRETPSFRVRIFRPIFVWSHLVPDRATGAILLNVTPNLSFWTQQFLLSPGRQIHGLQQQG